MDTYLWKLKKEKLYKTNLFLYSNFIKENFKIDAGHDFNKIWKWSVANPEIFWKSIWDFTKVKGALGKNLLKKSNIFYNNKFFFSLNSFIRFSSGVIVAHLIPTPIFFIALALSIVI